ncbi:hypothetical protein HID58_007574, partial [Brassica napus]
MKLLWLQNVSLKISQQQDHGLKTKQRLVPKLDFGSPSRDLGLIIVQSELVYTRPDLSESTRASIGQDLNQHYKWALSWVVYWVSLLCFLMQRHVVKYSLLAIREAEMQRPAYLFSFHPSKTRQLPIKHVLNYLSHEFEYGVCMLFSSLKMISHRSSKSETSPVRQIHLSVWFLIIARELAITIGLAREKNSTRRTKARKKKRGFSYLHVRARRGKATNSLAERARREKLNAHMKLLQELVPGLDRQWLSRAVVVSAYASKGDEADDAEEENNDFFYYSESGHLY